MKLRLTAAEIAGLKLPGLPGSKRNVNATALRDGWSERKSLCASRPQAGGGTEYHIDVLPPEARRTYVARHLDQLVPEATVAAAEAEVDAAGLRDRAAEGRDARLALVHAADRLARDANLPRRHADLLFVADYTAGRIDLAPWVRAAVPKLTLRSLLRWRAAALAGQTAQLGVDKGAARRGAGVLDRANDGQVRVYCLALLVKQPHLSADHVRRLVVGKFGPTLQLKDATGATRGEPVPPIRTLQHALSRWRASEKVLITALTNPDSFKSRYRLAGSNTAAAVTRLNEVWQIDASPMDALCLDGRHTVYLAIDVFSRRAVVYVTKTARAEAVGLLIRRAILAWGVPERIKTDNGSDFTAKASQRLLAALGIEHELCPPFSPEQKGFVERVIGTFQRDLGPLLPGFIGHSVADRKVIEARRAFAQRLGDSAEAAFCVELSATELQAYCDTWAADRYAHRPHAGLDGATPFAAAAAYRGSIRRVEDERALDMLLAPVAGRSGVRTVGKQGVRIDGSLYLAPSVMPDTEVVARMDPRDLGRAYLFSLDSATFLGEAICPEILGVDPAEAVARAKGAQKAMIEAGSAAIRREARKIKPRDFANTILGQAAAASGKVVALPRPSISHTTDEMDAALAALAPPPAPAVLDPRTRALQAEIEADLAAAPDRTALPSNVQPIRQGDTPQLRFRRAQELQARIDAGQTIPTADALWLGGYQAGPEHRSFQQLFEDFGEAALR